MKIVSFPFFLYFERCSSFFLNYGWTWMFSSQKMRNERGAARGRWRLRGWEAQIAMFIGYFIPNYKRLHLAQPSSSSCAATITNLCWLSLINSHDHEIRMKRDMIGCDRRIGVAKRAFKQHKRNLFALWRSFTFDKTRRIFEYVHIVRAPPRAFVFRRAGYRVYLMRPVLVVRPRNDDVPSARLVKKPQPHHQIKTTQNSSRLINLS